MKKLDLEQAYQDYLVKVKMKGEGIPPLPSYQNDCLRMAFMGGIGQYMAAQSETPPGTPIEEIAVWINQTREDLLEFWKKETDKFLSANN